MMIRNYLLEITALTSENAEMGALSLIFSVNSARLSYIIISLS